MEWDREGKDVSEGGTQVEVTPAHGLLPASKGRGIRRLWKRWIMDSAVFFFILGGIEVRWRTELDLNGTEALDHNHGTTTYRARPERRRAGLHFS